MAGVTLKNISKKFGEKTILKDINIDIQDGEFIVLVGASGCGKSTLLRMIAGLEKQTQGDIYIEETLVNDLAAKDRDIAMVFQNYALYPHLSVRENIALGLKVRHVAKCEIERRVKRASEILKLEDYLEAKPKELSGGQRQRVALARAIVREPKVFLMDEPLSNLDAKLRSEMRSEIKKLHQKLKTTFIYVTHDQTEALTMGDRIVVLNEGKIQQNDTPDNIYNHPQNVFVSTFMGVNPMNILRADVKDGVLSFANLVVDTSVFSVDVSSKNAVLLGIRPEKIVAETSASYYFNPIKFSAQVNFEENLGSYKNVYFNLADSEFCAVIEPQELKSETVNFSINPKDVYFFDYETQQPIERTL